MSQTFGVKGIILDRQVFREVDSKINIYSLGYGRLDLIVRGTKKTKSKLAGHIEPMSEVNLMVVKGKHYDYAGSVKMLNAFSGLKSDYKSLVSGGQIMQLFKRLISSGDIDDRLFFLLKDYLEIVNDKVDKSKSEIHSLFFVLKLVSYLGYSPHLNSCLVCGKTFQEEKYFFNYKEGGLICKFCQNNKHNSLLISKKTIVLMKEVLVKDINLITDLKINSVILAEFKKIITTYLRYNLDYQINL